MELLTQFDTALLTSLHSLCAGSLLDRAMVVITRLGDGGALWIALALLFLLRRDTRPIGLTMALAMAIAFVGGNLVLKNFVARPRPYTADPLIQLLIAPSHEPFSFPSGHALNAFAAAGSIGLWRKSYLWWALPLAGLIAFSRLYLRMHYPSDVLAGALLGFFAAWLAFRLLAPRLRGAVPSAKRD